MNSISAHINHTTINKTLSYFKRYQLNGFLITDSRLYSKSNTGFVDGQKTLVLDLIKLLVFLTNLGNFKISVFVSPSAVLVDPSVHFVSFSAYFVCPLASFVSPFGF